MITLDKIIKNKKLNVYQKNKIEWLNDNKNNGYISEETKKAYYSLLESHVHSLELANNKDLRKFTSVEIENIIKGSITDNHGTKRSIYAAINNYMIYNVERGFISYNPCDIIDTTNENLFAVNKRVLQKAYMELDDFYKYVDSLEANPIEKMLFILVRYGCPVQYTPEVRWEDVNYEDLTMNVIVKDKNILLPIDEEFIKRIEDAYNYQGNADDVYCDIGLIMKSKTDTPRATNSVYGITTKVAKASNKPKIDLGLLYKHRRMDMVKEIYKNKGSIGTSDLENILLTLGISATPSQTTSFTRDIKNTLDIKVKSKKTNKPIAVINIYTGEVIKTYKTAKLLTQNSKKDLGFYVDKLAVIKICKGEREEFKGLTFRYVNYLYLYDSEDNAISSTFFNKKIKKIKKDSKYKKRVVNIRTGQHDWRKEYNYNLNSLIEKATLFLKKLSNENNEVYLKSDSYEYKTMWKYSYVLDLKINELIEKCGFVRVDNQFSNESIADADKLEFDIEPLEENMRSNILVKLDNLESNFKEKATTSNKINRNKKLPKLLKTLYGYKCQLCNEEEGMYPSIEMINGEEYVEVHHITQLSEARAIEDESNSELDSYKNCIVVCCFHHKFLHYHHGGFKKLKLINEKLCFESEKGDIIPVITNYHLSSLK